MPGESLTQSGLGLPQGAEALNLAALSDQAAHVQSSDHEISVPAGCLLLTGDLETALCCLSHLGPGKVCGSLRVNV